MRWLAVVAILGGCDKLFGLTPLPGVDVAPPLAPVIEAIATGSHHACHIRNDGSLWCWGANNWGQLGVSSSEPHIGQPRQVDGSWDRVRSKWLHTCGIQRDNSLWCWGLNSQGQLGKEPVSPRQEIAPIQIAGVWKRVSPGVEHTCGVRADDDGVYCWGTNAFAQLGDGTLTPRATPMRIGTDTWLDVSAGYLHTCGIKRDDSLWCWGSPSQGALGNGSMDSSEHVREPIQIGASNTWARVSASLLYTCALTTDGRIRCWGHNDHGQLGNGAMVNSATPIALVVDGVDRDDWIDIATGSSHACALRRDGITVCWGASAHGQLGLDGDFASGPVALATPMPLAQIRAGGAHTCGVDRDGIAYCAGAAGQGQLGTGSSGKRSPTQVTGSWYRVSAGAKTTCAVANSSLNGYCGGDGTFDQLGLGTRRSHREPQRVGAGSWTDFAIGAHHTCALIAGAIYCWGHNEYGQVGSGAFTRSVAMPTQVGSMSVVSASNHTCGFTALNQLFCWGRNSLGQVGNGTLFDVPTPTAISNLSWTSIAAGAEHTCGLASLGTLLCWGRGAEGQLGNGETTSNPTTPSAVSQQGAYDEVDAGGHHTCGRKSTNQLYCWGHNDHGEVGNGATGVQASPVLVAGTWPKFSVGDHHVCAIDTANKLWCWGSNNSGQLGVPSILGDSRMPVQVGTDSDWSSVTAGAQHTCGIRASMLFCWGSNDYGQLLDGTGWRTTMERVP